MTLTERTRASLVESVVSSVIIGDDLYSLSVRRDSFSGTN